MKDYYPISDFCQPDNFVGRPGSSFSLGSPPCPQKSPGDCENPLPCLYSNNFTEDEIISIQTLNVFSPYHRKQSFVIADNVKRFINEYGIDNVGFLTLTFMDNVKSIKEASRRFKSLSTHYLNRRFTHWLLVKERQKRGAWHYHLLVDCQVDIKSGINFEELKNRKYTSANKHLRSIWSELREELPKYNFGRSELLPVRKNIEAMTFYVGKYISKHIYCRNSTDKGVRLFSSSQNWCKSSTKFAWYTDNSVLWRKKLSIFSRIMDCKNLDDLKMRLGSRWAYQYQNVIIDIDINMPDEHVNYLRKRFKILENSENIKDLYLHFINLYHLAKGFRGMPDTHRGQASEILHDHA